MKKNLSIKKGAKEVPNQAKGWLGKEVLSFKEALILLDISSSMLYKLTHQKYKPNGKLIYFKKDDLTNWMLSNKQLSNHEVENEIFKSLKREKNGK